ncbi:FAD:protein FMN transferase [Aquabacterium sp.]|uniref:FAD:protein FMN transferase n=1 Tax=Aquabacterium sp. TaxID=1872578 RepID=UPI002BA519A9|nr:FAD:protein FMN transferase [Aquabacterium sp.]HSW05927.1 FAD:protein FMN transferase [Aquabacterium sp.]
MAHDMNAARADAPPASMDRGRRRWVLGAALGAGFTAWPLVSIARGEPARLRASRTLMGTRVDIAAMAEDAALLRPALDAAFARMALLVDMMSHYTATSRLAAVNHAAGLQAVAVPPELMQVLAMGQAMSRRSGGAFDVTVGSVGRWHFDPRSPSMPEHAYIARHLPVVDYRQLVLDARAGTARLTRRGMRIDPGGIAKLYILAAGLETLRASGLETALVNGGGDVVAMTAAAARPWRVGIRDPHRPDGLIGALSVRHGFVASSGDYERCFVRDGHRYHHVLNPKTGYPAQGPHGVTLVGTDLAALNGLGAATMVLDTAAGRELLRSTPGVEGLIASREGALWITPALRSRLAAA